MRKVNKPKLDTDSPKCVLVVESSQLKLFSVEIKSKHNRVFVCSQAQILFVTPKLCNKKRAVHVASCVPFSCEHYNVVESCSLPTSAKNLQEEDIKSYNSDDSPQKMLLDALQPPEDFKYVVQKFSMLLCHISQ